MAVIQRADGLNLQRLIQRKGRGGRWKAEVVAFPYMHSKALVVATVILGFTACESFTEVLGPIPHTAALTGAAVRPSAVTTDAVGQLNATLDQETLRWSYTVGWEDLSSVPTGVHLHGPADASGVAEILAELNTIDTEMAPTSSASGALDLTAAMITPTVSGDSLRVLLNANQVYVDVHTENNTNGEIRGQLVRH